MHDLFRDEMVNNQIKYIGIPTNIIGWDKKLYLLAAFASMISIILFFIFGSYTETTVVTGRLIPHDNVVVVASDKKGYLSRILARQGQSVKKGDTLALVAHAASGRNSSGQISSDATTPLIASVDGVVWEVWSTVGQSISSSTPVLAIMPDTTAFLVELTVSGAAVQYLAPGTEISVRHRAFSARKLGSYKTIIADYEPVPLPQQANGPAGRTAKQQFYRLLARPVVDGPSQHQNMFPLLIGMHVEADIPIKKSSVRALIFNPKTETR